MTNNGVSYHDDYRSVSEERPSLNRSIKRSNSDDHLSAFVADDEEEIVQETKVSRPSQIPRLNKSQQFTSTPTLVKKNLSNYQTPRPLATIPPISRRAVQGILVCFFRNGDAYHQGVKIAINDLELKSWEAFLNYLNRQNKLNLASGGIRYVYSLNGREIRAMDQFQHQQSYVVASGPFIRTKYRHANDALNDDSDPLGNRRRSPTSNGEQIFVFPYSRLNSYESLIFSRNSLTSFDQWLHDQVSELLSRYLGKQSIHHFFAVTKFAFNEVKSFSQLFHLLKVTDTFIACTKDEFEQCRQYLTTVRPGEFFVNSHRSRKSTNTLQRYQEKQVFDEAQLSLKWIYGYDGTHEQSKGLHSLVNNEILYVIGSTCIIFEPVSKQQRFFTKHNKNITCLTTHQTQPIVASSETIFAKDRSRVVIFIWNSTKLETINELRRDQFGSDVSLLSFSSKSEENLILVISKDKPKFLLIVDWKRNEILFTLTCKSDRILSSMFVFDSIDWIVSVTPQHLTFYQINWGSKPVRLMIQREAEVQNIYTGAICSDLDGDQVIVGDKVGSVHIWHLVDQQPKLIAVKETILESDVQMLGSINAEVFFLANGRNQIKLWNIRSNDIEEIWFKEQFGAIQSVCAVRQRSNAVGLAIGTKQNCILYKDAENELIEVVLRGHITPTICLTCQRDMNTFFSVSSDRYLFKWHHYTRSVDWSIKCPQLISCADLHPERNIIVLGTESSKLLIYDTLSAYYVSTIVLKVNTGVKAVRFSPSGMDLAVGLQSGDVCVYDVLGNGDFRLNHGETSQTTNPPVTDVIWSTDSNYLLAVYTDNNYTLWTLPTFTVARGKNIQTIPWQGVVHPVTCSILDKAIIESHSSAIVISPNLVLACSKDGQLRLFRDYHERNYQTIQLGLGPIRSVIPSSTNRKTLLLSVQNHPAIVEIQLNFES